MSESVKEVGLWRNYRENKVGVEVEGVRRLMDPDFARLMADEIEAQYRDTGAEIDLLIADLRRYADDVE